MSTSFNDFLVHQMFEDILRMSEAKVIDILATIKKEINSILKENEELDDQKVVRYLRVIAAFEQFFRYMTAKKIKLTEVPGLKALVDNNNIENVNERNLEQSINKIIEIYSKTQTTSFKNAAEKRFKDFLVWFETKKQEDLKIIRDAIDFTMISIEQYLRDVRAV